MVSSHKVVEVESLKDTLGSGMCIVLIDYKGVNANEISGLRMSLRRSEAQMRVVKNTLMKLYLKDSEYNAVSDNLNGQIAIIYSKDPVNLCKVIMKHAKDNDKLGVNVGFFDGTLLKKNDIQEMSKIGTLEENRIKLLRIMNAPATKLAHHMMEPVVMLVRLLAKKASSEKL